MDNGQWRIDNGELTTAGAEVFGASYLVIGASHRVSAGAEVILTVAACAEPVEVQRIVRIVPRSNRQDCAEVSGECTEAKRTNKLF